MIPYLPKEHPDIPDSYGIKVFYLSGKIDEFELASHKLNSQTLIFEFVTKEDIWHWVPMANVCNIEFDNRFSKLIALKEKSEVKN